MQQYIRHTYSVLAIALRHPMLFWKLTHANIR